MHYNSEIRLQAGTAGVTGNTPAYEPILFISQTAGLMALSNFSSLLAVHSFVGI